MFHNFEELVAQAVQTGPKRIAVANAADKEVLETLKAAHNRGIMTAIVTGNAEEIRALGKAVGYTDFEVVEADSPEEAVEQAVRLVRDGKADILMKGFVNTAVFMRGVLNKEWGLRSGRLMSLLAVYELPFYHKLLFVSDSGINVAPDLEQKKQILANMLGAMAGIGMKEPKVAALAANEAYDPKVSASADAAGLAEAVKNGEVPSCILEGPISLDLAFSKEAAEHKGYESRISGDPDAVVFPNIESGNMLGKSWLLFNDAKWAGIVLGATHPVILGSRSDSAEVKLNSLALACVV